MVPLPLPRAPAFLHSGNAIPHASRKTLWARLHWAGVSVSQLSRRFKEPTVLLKFGKHILTSALFRHTQCIGTDPSGEEGRARAGASSPVLSTTYNADSLLTACHLCPQTIFQGLSNPLKPTLTRNRGGGGRRGIGLSNRNSNSGYSSIPLRCDHGQVTLPLESGASSVPDLPLLQGGNEVINEDSAD